MICAAITRLRREILLIRVKLLKFKMYCEMHKLITRRQRKRKQLWTRKWILRRDELGQSNTLMQESACEEPEDYRNIIRLSSIRFEELLQLVTPLI